MFALVFPVEFEIDVAAGGGHGEGSVCKLNDLLLDEVITDAFELRVHLEICCYDLDSHLNKRFNVCGGECLLIALACLGYLESDLIVIESFLIINLSLPLSSTLLGLDLGRLLCS